MSQRGDDAGSDQGGADSATPRIGDFGQILDASPDAIIVTDEAGRIVSFSKGAETTFGYRASEAVAQAIEMLLPERYRGAHPEHMRAFGAGEASARYMGERGRIVGQRKDGTEFPAEASISRLHRGGKTLFAAILRDVSERVATERALRQSEEEARALIEQAADAIVVIGGDGVVGEVNMSTASLLGCSVGEIEGRPFLDFVPEQDREPLAARFAEVQAGSAIDSERDILRPDGARVRVQLRGNALADGRVLVAMRDLTEAREAARALEASEELFRTTFEQAPLAISVLGPDMKRLWVNHAATEFYGYNTSELLSRSPSELSHPEDLAAEDELLTQMRRGERDAYSMEKRYIRKDGSIAWGALAVRAIRNESGAITRYIAQLKDVTARKAAERALEESEERARVLFEEAADAIAVIRPDGILSEVNQSTADLLGMTREQVVGRHFREFIPARDREATGARFAAVVGGERLTVDRPVLRRDGKEVPVHLAANALSDGRVLAAMRDLSERIAAEEAVRTSEELFRTTFESSPIGIALGSPEGRRVWVNDAFCRFTGYTREELLSGVTFQEITSAEDVGKAEEYVRRLTSGEIDSYSIEKKYLRKDGEEVWGRLAAAALRDAAGNVRRYIGQVVDITESKRAEEALRRSEARLREAQELARLGSWDLDLQTNQVVYSNEVYRILELQPRPFESSTERFYAVVHPEDRELVQGAFRDAVDNWASYGIDHRLLMPDGRVKWVRETGQTSYAEHGVPQRTLGTIQDITERYLAEQAVRESEERLREAQEIAHLGSWELDLDSNKAEYSAEVYRILELNPLPFEESTARFFALVHPDDREAVQEHYRASVRARTPYGIDHRLLMPDGRVKWVRQSGHTFYTATGRPSRTLGTIQDITERYLAEQAVRESEERLREAQAMAHLGSWELDLVSDELAWSEEIYRIFELDPDAFEASYDGFLEAIHPGDRAMVDEAYRQSVLDGRPYTIEHRLLMHDGRVKWVRETGRTAFSDDGQAMRSVGTVQDITERHAAEQALQESEELFRTTFEASPVGVTITDPAGRRLWVNEALYEMLGYTREELMTASIRAITHPADVAEDERLSRLLAEGDVGFFRMEKRYVRKDHAIIWGLLTAAAIRDEAGEVVRYIRQVEDITEQKRAREALRASEERLRSVIERSPVILFTLDAEGVFTFLDGEALKTLGVQAESLVGESIWDQSWVSESMAEALRSVFTGSSVNEVVTFGDRIFDVQMAPMERDGMVLGATGVMLDVTERRSLEAQLRRSQRLESLGQFAGGIAHDFNNLLTVINGHAELVSESLPPDEPLLDEVKTILEAGQRGSALTRQLLAFSRRQVVEPQLINLNEVVENLEGMLRRLLGARVELVTDLGRRLGLVRADAGQMEQVLMNLVINARDAMANGGRVAITTKPCPDDGTSICLSVSDTGTGMSEHTREHLFDPFFTTKEQGTGLGLATVHGIVTQAGGKIDVESRDGEGTVFTVRLPRAAESGVSDEGPLTGEVTILVVEPDDGVRRLLVTVLQRQGYAVRDTNRPEVALGTAPGSFALIVASLTLPGVTAPEFMRRLRSAGVEEPVVFTAGDGDPEGVEEVARLGADFVRKPLTADELVRRVREAIERSRVTRGG